MTANVDASDINLISHLEQNGRASFAQLGKLTGMSSETARLRYLRLVEEGVVRVIGVVNPANAGLTTVAAVYLVVYGRLTEVTAALQHRREVTFLAWSSGEYNMVCEVACEDPEALARVVYDEIASMQGVVDVRLQDYLRMYKWDTGIRIAPFDPTADGGDSRRRSNPVLMDAVGTELVRLLREDGRRPFTELANEVGLPYGIVRRRCQALLEAGVVQIAAVVDRVLLRRSVMAGVLLTIDGNVDTALREVAALNGVEILFRTSGPQHAVAEVTAPSEAAILDLVDQEINAVVGVRSTSLLIYTAIKKLPSQWRFDAD